MVCALYFGCCSLQLVPRAAGYCLDKAVQVVHIVAQVVQVSAEWVFIQNVCVWMHTIPYAQPMNEKILSYNMFAVYHSQANNIISSGAHAIVDEAVHVLSTAVFHARTHTPHLFSIHQ